MKTILAFLLLASTPAIADSMGPITNNTGIVVQGASGVGSCLSKDEKTASTSTKTGCDKIEGTFHERGSIPLEGPKLVFPAAETFFFRAGPNAMVTITPEGKVTYGEGYTPDAAARAFWEAVGQARCAK